MHQDSLNELEAAMLKKRLKFLRQRRDDEVAATLPSSSEEDWEDDDNEAIETGDLLARLVANELLSDEDTEGELAEPADRSDV